MRKTLDFEKKTLGSKLESMSSLSGDLTKDTVGLAR